MKKFTIADRFKAFVNPQSVSDARVRNMQISHVEQLVATASSRSAYKAAEWNRTNANWIASNEDVNTMLRRELPMMRHRSRYLLRNIPNAVSAMNAMTGYCVGVGIRQISTIYDEVLVQDEDGNEYLEQKEDEAKNSFIDDMIDQWAVNVDIGATVNCPVSLYDNEELVLRKVVEDGEAFVHAPIDKENPVIPISLEMFEPEMLAESKSGSVGRNDIILGIELDQRTRRPLFYWFKDGTKIGERISATDMFHVFERKRPGQLRGVPAMHAVSEKFFMLEEYESAELLGAKIAACMSVFIERPAGVGPDGDLMPGTGGTNAQDADGNSISHLQPGVIGSVANGANVHVIQPQKPGSTYGMFTEHLERNIGAGIEGGLSFEALTRNTSKSSYAGGRLATQADHQVYRKTIKMLIDKYCRGLRNRVLDVAVMSGKVECPGYDAISIPGRKNPKDRLYWGRHEWLPPAWQYGVNPVDDIAASTAAMRSGLSDLSIESGFLGRNWENTLRVQARVKKRAKALGLTLTSDGAYSIQNGLTAPPASSETAGKTTNDGGNTA